MAMAAERVIVRARRRSTKRRFAVVQIVVHPAVVVILLRLAALGIGHHFFECIPIVHGQTRVFHLLWERQGRRSFPALAQTPITQQDEQVSYANGGVAVDIGRMARVRTPRAQQDEQVLHADRAVAVEISRTSWADRDAVIRAIPTHGWVASNLVTHQVGGGDKPILIAGLEPVCPGRTGYEQRVPISRIDRVIKIC